MFDRLIRSKALRRRTAWFLALIMVPPFIFFFHMWGRNPAIGDPAGAAGELFGRPVTWEAFRSEYQVIRQGLETQFGTVPEGLEAYLRQQTWNQLILRHEAKRQRVPVGKEELAQVIRNQDTFQRNGQFVPELYYQFVRAVGLTPQLFEERMREDVQTRKLLDAVRAEVILTDEELTTAYAEAYNQLRAALLVYDPSMFQEAIRQSLTEDDLRASYAAQQETLRIPLQRTIAYLGRSQTEVMPAPETISDEAMAEYYDARVEQFTDTEGVVQELGTVREVIRQRLRVQLARDRLMDVSLDLEDDLAQGRRFEEIATARGLPIRQTDPRSESAPGIPNGPTAVMLQQAFALPVGQMTQMFDTPSGVFLLKPIEEFPSRIPPFAEVQSRLEDLVVEERSRAVARTHATQTHRDVRERLDAGLTFDESCVLLELEPLRLPPFRRRESLAPLGYVPAVNEALFETAPGQLAQMLEAPRGFVVAFVEELFPFDAEQFANERDEFRQTTLIAKQQEHTAVWFDALRTRANLKSYLDQPLQPAQP